MPHSAADSYDVVVIGAGHNGLTCAGYLARAGLRVKVVERRGVVGGAAVTETFHPGFRNSVCAYVVSLLDPKVIRELELARHGLDIIDRSAGTLSLLADGRHLLLSHDAQVAAREIGKFSDRDAGLYPTFERRLVEAARFFRGVALATPPNLGGGLRDLIAALRLGNRARRLGPEGQATLAELMTKSIGDFLDAWFESDPIKGVFGFEGIVGNMVSPYAAGSAYVLLHHYFGQVNGRTGAWGHARGGMGAIAEAMARSAVAKGVAIELAAPAREVIVERGRAVGIALEDGRVIRARAVASNLNPKLLLLRLIDPAILPADFRRRIENWRCRSGSFRMNLALSELPPKAWFSRFSSLSISSTLGRC